METERAEGIVRTSPFLAVFIVLLVIATAYRVWTLSTGPSQPADLTLVRDAAAAWLADTTPLPVDERGVIAASSLDPRLMELGVDRIELERFDPQALVVIRPGADGKPGTAGIDDNGDGIVDNRIELGATRSDDQCVVVAAGDTVSTDPTRLVLQRGAFAPETSAAESDQPPRRRAIVIGHSDKEPWSFLVQL